MQYLLVVVGLAHAGVVAVRGYPRGRGVLLRDSAKTMLAYIGVSALLQVVFAFASGYPAIVMYIWWFTGIFALISAVGWLLVVGLVVLLGPTGLLSREEATAEGAAPTAG